MYDSLEPFINVSTLTLKPVMCTATTWAFVLKDEHEKYVKCKNIKEKFVKEFC